MFRTLGNLQQPVLGIVEKVASRFRAPPKPAVPAEGFAPLPATTPEQIESIIQALHDRSTEWASTPASERAKILRQCIDTTLEVAEDAATAATRVKGSEGWGIGEELLAISPIILGMREYMNTLEAGAEGSKPYRLYKRPNGQWVADVFPVGLEALVFGGFIAEVWIQPGKEPTRGQMYRRKATESDGGVGVVLGAGNQTSVAALDILHVLIAENRVVVCKMNPVNEYMGPFLRRAFSPLVDRGFLEFAYGGGDVGDQLCNHALTSSVHLTGSVATYDSIVWQGKPKQGEPPFKKPVTAELGCVTPYLIVPGQWSESDLEYHAQNVVAALTNNAGHNCLKAELIITDAAWPQRGAYLAALRRRLAESPNRIAYYPGSGHKAASFKRRFPDAEEIGGRATFDADGALIAAPEGQQHVDIRRLPWLLKTGLRPEEAATQDENWCGVLQEIALPNCNGDPGAFLKAAVDFANDTCWGTLSCGMFIHPKTQKQYRKEYDEAIEKLRYGAIAVNVPTLAAFAIVKLPWGGYPGVSTPQDIGSGNAFVHNTMLFDHVEKGVIQGPFRMHPTPVWFASNRSIEEVARLNLKFYAQPTLANMAPMMPKALTG